MTAIRPRLFSNVSAVSQRQDGRFSGTVDPEWTIEGKPNGGYLLAMLGRAAAATTAHAHVIAASAHYLHAPVPGPVLIETELLRAGRSTSQVRAAMSQHGLDQPAPGRRRSILGSRLAVGQPGRLRGQYPAGRPQAGRAPGRHHGPS